MTSPVLPLGRVRLTYGQRCHQLACAGAAPSSAIIQLTRQRGTPIRHCWPPEWANLFTGYLIRNGTNHTRQHDREKIGQVAAALSGRETTGRLIWPHLHLRLCSLAGARWFIVYAR